MYHGVATSMPVSTKRVRSIAGTMITSIGRSVLSLIKTASFHVITRGKRKGRIPKRKVYADFVLGVPNERRPLNRIRLCSRRGVGGSSGTLVEIVAPCVS